MTPYLFERFEMIDLAGKVAVITGGSSGIGLATGRALAREGMRIVLADVNEARLDAAVKERRDEGFEARGYAADVSKFESMRQLATTVLQDYGRADLVHLNAGIGALGNFFDDETESWVQTVHINYLGIVWGIKAFIPHMIDTGDEGMVLATGSPSASEGTTYSAPAYSASKAALLSVMESLYGQLRDRKSSIRVAVAFPLLTATNIGGNPRMMHV